MIIGFDIGNTQTVTGIFDETGKLLLKFRVASNNNLTEDEFFSYLKSISDFNKLEIKSVNEIVISSVVPNLTNIFIYLSNKYFNLDPIIVNSTLKIPFSFANDLENPKELGADRLTNIFEGVIKYPNKDLVIIDFGTATTFDVIKNNQYIGGCILPGINLSIKSLFKNTAKLPDVRFERPKSIIGKNTIEHINAGIYFGSIGQIKEILHQISKTVSNPIILATGGLAETISEDVDKINIYIPNLTLSGLYTIYNYTKNK